MNSVARIRLALYMACGALVATSALLLVLHKPHSVVLPTQKQTLSVGVATHTATNMQAVFYESLNVKNLPEPIAGRVYGGIVSHHLYMEAEIGKLFLSWRTQRPSVVVVIGPNHFNAGDARVQVSREGYRTPFGVLDSASAYADELLRRGVVLTEEKPFEQEHAIGALVPYIKHTWPDAKLLPIIIKRTATDDQVESLSRALEGVLPNDALVLASVDFSHHLDRFAAEFHDRQSVSALESGDIHRIKSLEVDSPQSLQVLERYLQTRGAQYMSYMNTNQALVSGNLLSSDVTSYVFATFTKGALNQTAPAVTFMHYGAFNSDTFSDSLKPDSLFAGPEHNLLRGADLKVTAIVGGPCRNDGETVSIYKVHEVSSGSCPLQSFGAKTLGGGVGFVRLASSKDAASAIANARQEFDHVVVQVKDETTAQMVLDLGADAAFVEGHAPGLGAYNRKPIIFLSKPGQSSGFSTGLVFGQKTSLYIFPYSLEQGKLVRPDIKSRLQSCAYILRGLSKVDGCNVQMQ